MFHSQARSAHNRLVGRIFRLAVRGSSIAVFSTALYAQQAIYTVGVTADITGGGNGPDLNGVNQLQNAGNFVPFYATYPSVTFNARGEHTTLSSIYAFGYNKNLSDPSYETTSHTASLNFSTRPGPSWEFYLSDSFSMTSDISTFRLLSGVESNPDQFQYVFTPVFGRSNRSNTASIGADRTINRRSSLTFVGAFSRLDYPENALTAGILTDQKRISASATYTYKGEHYSWSLGYAAARFNFARFENALNHSAILGFSYQFSPVLSFQINVGPSYLESLENTKSPVGVNVTAALNRRVQKGSFTLTVSQTSGDSSGLGSVSSYRNAVLAMSRALGKSTTLSADVSGFDTQGLQLSAPSSRGVVAGASIALALGREWSMNWGGQYQHYEGYNTSGYDQKRIFMSLRYSKPELWRF